MYAPFLVLNVSYQENLPAYISNMILSYTIGPWVTVLVSFSLKILCMKLVQIYRKTYKAHISQVLTIHQTKHKKVFFFRYHILSSKMHQSTSVILLGIIN